MKTTQNITCRQTDIEEIIDLRQEIIIKGTGRDSPYFDGDHDATTLHFGAFNDQKNVGCLTYMLNSCQEKPARQLRGMASAAELQGGGVGKLLLQTAESFIKQNSDIKQLWCNARKIAIGFYQKQGWQIASKEFNIPGVGPHQKMTKIIM